MSEILTERSGSILRIQLNRPEKKNAMTFDMSVTLAELFSRFNKCGRPLRGFAVSSA